MADSGQQLIEAALAAVEDRVTAQIEQARQRRERDRQQRAQRLAARRAGLAKRHAQKLRNLRSPEGHAAPGANAIVTVTVTAEAGSQQPPEQRSRYTPYAREARS
ncbi:hypothetical protein AB0D14_02060 [Streptomyces sp. NPDC048484]|uniref:hypothetical protein n=1 Tax=Streptomyces sp. NPDC048484 TaxID=3155146 RepID=UPI0034361EFD